MSTEDSPSLMGTNNGRRSLLFWAVLVTWMLYCVSVSSSSSSSMTMTMTRDSSVPSITTTRTTTTTTTASSLSSQCSNVSISSCEECVKITSCFYCMKTKKCEYYPYKHIFPSSKDCEMGDVRWGVCWFNFKAMVISMAVIGGIILISLITCICCCCRNKNRTKLLREDAKYEREREERRVRSDQRKKERQTKYDEIRRKYGLVKDDHPYQRFEA